MACGQGDLEDLVACLFGGGAGSGCGCSGPGGYPESKSARIQVDATDLAPFSIPLEGIAAVRLVAVRSTSGASMKLRASSTNGGASQVWPISDVLVAHLPGSGDELTALSLSGTGEVEYLIAGQ